MITRSLFMAVAIGIVFSCSTGFAADEGPTAQQTLKRYLPTQKNVDYETPPANELDKCTMKPDQSGKASGWVVYGPQGQVLRRFLDTNKDNMVDQWSFYNHGIEVYRDLDTNNNNKMDQSRWLNNGGTRWGIDKNEDGRIDEWKRISAAEATKEAVAALISGDDKHLETLLINADDLKQLGVNAAIAKKLTEAVSSPAAKLRKVLAETKMISPKTEWMRFDSAPPCIILPEHSGASKDILIYENAMAIVQNGAESGFVHIGEMVEVGDVWKLTQIPQPLEGNSIEISVGGVFLQPNFGSESPDVAGTPGISPETQKLLEELQTLDQNAPAPSDGPEALGKYNTQRADLLVKLVQTAKTDQERDQWIRQMIESIAASVQMGHFPGGLTRLKAYEKELRAKTPDSDLVPFVGYKRMIAEYSERGKKAKSNADQRKVHDWWTEELSTFAKEFPKAPVTPDAMIQLAMAYEFQGQNKEARQAYKMVATGFSDTKSGERAAGAVKRLDLEGKPFSFSGSGLNGNQIATEQYRGKTLLVVFWSTWSPTHTEELPQLTELYNKHKGSGLEIIGINLDVSAEALPAFLKQHKVTWPQIHEPGGLESRPAVSFGILNPSTTFLIGADGKVISNNISATQLEAELPDILKQ